MASPDIRRSKARAMALSSTVRLCSASKSAAPFGRQVNNLGINDDWLSEPRRFLDNAWIALGPVGAVHRVEPHATAADMDLMPVAVMLELVRPTGASWGLLGDGRLTGMNESSRCI